MSKKALAVTLAALALLLGAGTASAQRAPVPVVNYEKQAWTRAEGSKLSAEQVKQGIVSTIQAHKVEGKFPWQLDSAADGKLAASVRVRGKHTVRVLVAYTPDGFDLTYQGSDNMKAGKDENGQDIIHPFYNHWAGDLARAIREHLGRM